MSELSQIEIFEKICKIFTYNKESKMISYNSKDGNLYKYFLFRFCFLSKNGPIKFENIENIWFFQTFEITKKNILLDIIDYLIYIVENKEINIDERIIDSVQSLINLNSKEIFMRFKYLQSIYSSYNEDKMSSVLFPLYYSIALNDKNKNDLKNDLKYIVDNHMEKYSLNEDIDFSNINLDFLSKINLLISYIKANKEEKEIISLYKYLCNFNSKSTSEKYIQKYPESFNYFSKIKNIILNAEEKFDVKEKENKNINNNEKEINNSSSLGNKKIKPIERTILLINFKYADLKELISKILTLLNKMEFDNYLNIINRLKYEKFYNNILTNKLSISILFLQNSNLFINLKRKIVDSLMFDIIKKYVDYFSLSSDYIPNKSNLNELKDLLEKKIKLCEKNKDTKKDEISIINKDILRLEEFNKSNSGDIIKKVNVNEDNNQNVINEVKKDNIFLIINTENDTGKKLKVIFDFLRFCKNYFNTFSQLHSEELNKTLFKSDLKYEDYFFDDIIPFKQEESNILFNEKDSNDYKNDKNTKIIKIEKALDILLSERNIFFNENIINELYSKKKGFKKKNKIYNELSLFDTKGFDNEFESINKEDYNYNAYKTKLDSYDKIINTILNDNMNINEAKIKLKEINDFIKDEIKKANKNPYNMVNSNLDFNEIYKQMSSIYNNLLLILKFIETHGKKFLDNQRKIYSEYEKSLNDLLNKKDEMKNYFQNNSIVINESLFEKWINSKPDIENKYYYLKYFKNIFEELIESIKYDLNISFDENFAFWAIKNKFDIYFK